MFLKLIFGIDRTGGEGGWKINIQSELRKFNKNLQGALILPVLWFNSNIENYSESRKYNSTLMKWSLFFYKLHKQIYLYTYITRRKYKKKGGGDMSIGYGGQFFSRSSAKWHLLLTKWIIISLVTVRAWLLHLLIC